MCGMRELSENLSPLYLKNPGDRGELGRRGCENWKKVVVKELERSKLEVIWLWLLGKPEDPLEEDYPYRLVVWRLH